MRGIAAPDLLRIYARRTRRNRTKQAVPVGLFCEARGRDQHAPVAEFVAEDVPVFDGFSREAVDKGDYPVHVADQEMPQAQRPATCVYVCEVARAYHVVADRKQSRRKIYA